MVAIRIDVIVEALVPIERDGIASVNKIGRANKICEALEDVTSHLLQIADEVDLRTQCQSHSFQTPHRGDLLHLCSQVSSSLVTKYSTDHSHV
jgi:hypothetical protein